MHFFTCGQVCCDSLLGAFNFVSLSCFGSFIDCLCCLHISWTQCISMFYYCYLSNWFYSHGSKKQIRFTSSHVVRFAVILCLVHSTLYPCHALVHSLIAFVACTFHDGLNAFQCFITATYQIGFIAMVARNKLDALLHMWSGLL